jgi:hypothetical protein
MNTYVEEQGLSRFRGRIVPRNSHTSPWVSVLDLRFAQELPIFRKTRGIVTFDIENFANLIDNSWGQLPGGFPSSPRSRTPCASRRQAAPTDGQLLPTSAPARPARPGCSTRCRRSRRCGACASASASVGRCPTGQSR